MPKDVFTKVMPHSLEAEASVLGAMLLDRKAIDVVTQLLKPEDFYSEQNKWVFNAVWDMSRKGLPVDSLTLAEELKKEDVFDKIGGYSYLAKIGDSVFSTANIEQYCNIIKEKAIKRYLIESFNNISATCYQDKEDCSVILELAQKLVYDISINRSHRDFVPLAKAMDETLVELSEAYKNPSSITGVATGFPDFDNLTAGLQKGDLILIAARPSMGKTALAINIAQNVAYREDKNVAVFSLEMSNSQLTTRIISSESKVDSKKMKIGRQNASEWGRIINTITGTKNNNVKMFLDDTSGITPSEVRNKCRKLKATKGLDLIIIDYLQLMTPSSNSESRQQEISSISRDLKGIAKELDCPLIALSQLSRAPEARTNKRPMLSDLRESGAIEQDADLVCMLYRDKYYNPESEDNSTEVIIAKNRNGETRTVKLEFKGEFTTFIPYEETIINE